MWVCEDHATIPASPVSIHAWTSRHAKILDGKHMPPGLKAPVPHSRRILRLKVPPNRAKLHPKRPACADRSCGASLTGVSVAASASAWPSQPHVPEQRNADHALHFDKQNKYSKHSILLTWTVPSLPGRRSRGRASNRVPA